MPDTLDPQILARDKQRMLRGSILMSLSPLSALFLGIIISLLIDAYIPPENYALYSWFTLVYTLFATLIAFRLPMAIVFYLAAAKGASHEEELQSLKKTNTIFALVLAPLSGIIAFLAIPFIFDNYLFLSGQYIQLDVIICALGVVAFTLSLFTTAALKGNQEFGVIGIGQVVSNFIGQIAVSLLLILGIGYLGIITLGIQVLMLKWIIVGFLTVILLSVAVRKMWTLKGNTYPIKPLLKFSTPLLLSFLVMFFFSEFLVRLFLDPFTMELGLYAFAVRIATYVNALTLGFYATLGSYYAQSYGRGSNTSVENDLRWTLKISVFLFLPLIVGSMVISPALFLLLFENYYWAYQYFIILMAQIIMFLFKKPYTQTLNVFGRTNLNLIIQVISSVLSGLLMFLFFIYGPLFVSLGLIDNALLLVVLGYISSTFFALVLLTILIKQKIGIQLGIRGVFPLLLIGFLIIPPAIVIHFLYLPPLFELAIIIPMSMIIYLLPIRYFRLISETEIRKASQFLPKRLASSFANIITRLFVRKSNN